MIEMPVHYLFCYTSTKKLRYFMLPLNKVNIQHGRLSSQPAMNINEARPVKNHFNVACVGNSLTGWSTLHICECHLM